MIAGDLLGMRARLTPSRTAFISVVDDARYTYAEANERATRCALLWQALELQPGDRVGILARNRIEYVDAFFAAGKSGIILVPLNYRLSPAEIESIARDAGLSAIMYEADFAHMLAPTRAAGIVKHWIALDQASADDLSYREGCEQHAADKLAPHDAMPEDVYCILYTSGTTGVPKGVMIPHRQVMWNAYNTAICWELTSSDVAPVLLPMCHAGGLFVFMAPLIAAGGTLAIHRSVDVGEILHCISQYAYTVVMAVPTIYKGMLEHAGFAAADLSHIRWMISGGAPLPIYLIEAYQQRGVTFKQGYGLTEVGVNCFAMSEHVSRNKLGSVGTPFLFTEARLMTADGRRCAAGEIGELQLRGPHVCLGYWRNPTATAAVLDAQGWFHTGDQAWCDEDDCFYIAGRSKDMFISGGMNVYPAEIENALLLNPAVQEVAVVAVPHPKWGETGVAFVVLRHGLELSRDSLQATLIEKIARYKLPSDYIFVDELPRNALGKVVKPTLQKLYAEQFAARSQSNS
ncbi:MAG TPA: AMP-binding protein [Terriglobales bacterium]